MQLDAGIGQNGFQFCMLRERNAERRVSLQGGCIVLILELVKSGRIGKGQRAALHAYSLMIAYTAFSGHRQGEQQLIAIVPLAIDGEDRTGLCRNDLAGDGGGSSVGPGRDAQMQRESGTVINADGDADIAADGIAALDIQADGSAGKTITHLAGRIGSGVQTIVAGKQPLVAGKARPGCKQRAQGFAVLQREEAGNKAGERETGGTREPDLIALLNSLHAAAIRRKGGGYAVIHHAVELIGHMLAGRRIQQGLQRGRQFTQRLGAHAAAGMRACQQRIAGNAAAHGAMRLVHAGKAGFRRGKMLAGTGELCSKRTGAQTFAKVGAVGGAQQMMRIAITAFGGERFIERLLAHGAGNRRAVGEAVKERGIIRALRDERHEHGEDGLLRGDIVEHHAAFERISSVHGILGAERTFFKRILEELHIAQHEGKQALVAGDGIGAAKRAQHAAASSEGFILCTEAAVLTLAVHNGVHEAQAASAQLFITKQGGGEQGSLQHIGGVHAAEQLAAKPGALGSGVREDGFAAGEKAAAQGEQLVAQSAAGSDGAGGERRKAARIQRCAGEECTGKHRQTSWLNSRMDAVKRTEETSYFYSLQFTTRYADTSTKELKSGVKWSTIVLSK